MDKEDGPTAPPTKTLKQTTISDKKPLSMPDVPESELADVGNGDGDKETAPKATTPEPTEPHETQAEHLKRLASPKKKRGREQDDDVKESEGEDRTEDEPENNNNTDGATSLGRSLRSAPEKKRPRDASVEPTKIVDMETKTENIPTSDADDPNKAASAQPDASEPSSKDSAEPIFGSASNGKPQSSTSAFANSTFGALADKPSGFAALAGKPSIFGGGSAAPLAGFGASVSSTTAPSAGPSLNTGFGGFQSATNSTTSTFQSGFGGLAKGRFGSTSAGIGGTFGGGFGGSFATPVFGQKLSSFSSSAAIPAATAEKPAKAFGAPESDAEEGSDDGESENGGASDEEEKTSNAGDDKKKIKVSKVPIYDGEEGETTLIQFRAKLFWIESKETGWKERGVGTLKLNVPKSYVEYDNVGAPILGTFDPSGRDEDDEGDDKGKPEPTAARLVMRQENTHRVILNTPIIKALKFEEKPSNTAMTVMFTAFEEGKPVNMLLRMSEANSKLLVSEIAAVKREL